MKLDIFTKDNGTWHYSDTVANKKSAAIFVVKLEADGKDVGVFPARDAGRMIYNTKEGWIK